MTPKTWKKTWLLMLVDTSEQILLVQELRNQERWRSVWFEQNVTSPTIGRAVQLLDSLPGCKETYFEYIISSFVSAFFPPWVTSPTFLPGFPFKEFFVKLLKTTWRTSYLTELSPSPPPKYLFNLFKANVDYFLHGLFCYLPFLLWRLFALVSNKSFCSVLTRHLSLSFCQLYYSVIYRFMKNSFTLHK